jgi:CheY-like chemotaxis protein
MDVSFPEGQVAGPKAVQSIRAHAHGRVPVIFISARDTIGSRLAAVRAGARPSSSSPSMWPS